MPCNAESSITAACVEHCPGPQRQAEQASSWPGPGPGSGLDNPPGGNDARACLLGTPVRSCLVALSLPHLLTGGRCAPDPPTLPNLLSIAVRGLPPARRSSAPYEILAQQWLLSFPTQELPFSSSLNKDLQFPFSCVGAEMR